MSEPFDTAEVPASHEPRQVREAPSPGNDATTVFATALTELAQAVQAGELDPLVILAEGAMDLIPGTEYSALVVPAGPDRLAARATNGSMTLELVDLQNRVGEGPGLDAVERPDLVWVPDLAVEERWSLFTPAARELGVASMMSVPLVAGERVLGALTLAADRPNAFDSESQAMAGLFAAHAAIALSGEQWRTNLTTALGSRDVIGQAKGILMERFRVTPDAAFALLVKASQRTHTKLRTVSEELCRTGVLPAG